MLLVAGLCPTGLTLHWEEERSEKWQELSWGFSGYGAQGGGLCQAQRRGLEAEAQVGLQASRTELVNESKARKE